MTQLNQQFTGGHIQRYVAWNGLGEQIQDRPDRVEAILRGTIPLERVANYSKTSNPELGKLLEGTNLGPLPQVDRDTKDPDVWALFSEHKS